VGKRLFGTGSTQACQGDLAFVVLDRDLALPTVSVRLDRMAAWQESVNVLGYGQTKRVDHQGMRIIRQVEVLDVGPATTTEPTRTTAPRTFVVGNGPCKGDSGGPAFSLETGALLGVFSLNGAASCDAVGIRNVYTSVAPFSKLALDAYAAAGVEPNLENGLPVEVEPRKSTEVADSGCALAAPHSTTPWAFAALGLAVSGLVARRRRTRA
jgi:secreted trypsin-like serine protease